ncbi:MAG TPA: hypothetical protein VLM87_13530 [Rubrivivax sp.]|nr:hypothetical protein [Rubrivivax sp.]
MRVLACPKFKLDAAAQQEFPADHFPWAEVVAVPRLSWRISTAQVCVDALDPAPP